MHPAILRHVFAQEIDADIHQFNGIERRATKMGGVGGMGSNALETIKIFQHREIVGGAHAVEGRGMPCQSRIDIVKKTGTHHESLAGTALFAGAAIITHRAGQVVGFQMPGKCDGGHQRADAEQIVAAAMAGGVGFKRFWLSHAGHLTHASKRVKFA
ncbi:hypothetical protein D3C87_1387110 [compost metagenome]